MGLQWGFLLDFQLGCRLVCQWEIQWGFLLGIR